jgi:hypothetical protein
MKKILIAVLLTTLTVPSFAETAETSAPEKQEPASSVRGYIGVGLLGSSITEENSLSGEKIMTTDVSTAGITINGGAKWNHFRLGLDIGSTVGDAKATGILPNYVYGGAITFDDVSFVRYSVEGVGIIHCSDMFDLELGLSLGRARAKIDTEWSDWFTPIGIVVGGVINFNQNHALGIYLKGYGYSIDETVSGYDVKTEGAIGEFAITYRYSF